MSPVPQAKKKPRAAAHPAARHVRSGPHGTAETAAARPGGRRLQVRRSGIHGKGVYALQPISAGDTLIEYVGEVISWKEAVRRHPHDPEQPDHTFYFHLDDKRVIDGNVGGNASRWINHACEPNLEADDSSGRVFLVALRDIAAGEELLFDYGLVIDERLTPALKKRFACWCGAASCRGTMLAPKRAAKPRAEAVAKRAVKKAAKYAAKRAAKQVVKKAGKTGVKPAGKQASQKAAPQQGPRAGKRASVKAAGSSATQARSRAPKPASTPLREKAPTSAALRRRSAAR